MTTKTRLQTISSLPSHCPVIYGEGDNDGIPLLGRVDRTERLILLVRLLDMHLELHQFRQIVYLWDNKGTLSVGMRDSWPGSETIVKTIERLWEVLDGPDGNSVQLYLEPPWGWHNGR